MRVILVLLLILIDILYCLDSPDKIDWNSILRAEATCCPGHAKKGDCQNEGGSNCKWLPRNSPILALTGGDRCVGNGYAKCKKADIDACCAPGCPGNGPPATPGPPGSTPSPKPEPICGPKTPSPVTPAPVTPAPTTPAPTTPAPTTPAPTTPAPTTPAPTTPAPTTPAPTTPAPTTPAPTTPAPTTPSPTPSPTNEGCAIGVNYAFEGYPCQVSGDPHTKLPNGAKHDFQGQPTTSNVLGALQNQFYYIARCNGYDCGDMPFQVLFTHFHWGTRPVSGVDYLTFEFCNPDYRVYFSSSIGAYALASDPGVSTNYDTTMDNGAATQLTSGTPITLGGRFKIEYNDISTNQANIKITIDNDAEIYIYMKGQMNRETATVGGFTDVRYRMHYVYIKFPSLYKCAHCGLCGNFKDMKSGTYPDKLEACDGTYVNYRPGWNKAHTPEAYDLFGWTYEYNFFNNDCSANYDITSNTNGLVYVDPCDQSIAQDVINACAAKRTENQDCCDNTIGGNVCAELQDDCNFDACVVATDTGKTQAAIDAAVQQLMGNAIDAACNIPGVGDDNNADNTAEQEYIGCYLDTNDRAMPYRATNVNGRDLQKCVENCDNNGYKYMGLQYGVECFCSNDRAGSLRYGLQTNKAQCDKFGDKGDTSGCWGGEWTMCIYEITKLTATKQQYILSFHGMQQWLEYNNMDPTITIMTSIIILFAVIGLIYYYRYQQNNKHSKYIPINDPKANRLQYV